MSDSSSTDKRHGGVRAKLAILVAACVLPIAIMAMCLVYLQYEREQSAEREVIIGRARAMVSALDREFSRTESALFSLSTAPILASDDLSRFHLHASRALQYINADSVVVLDSSGKMLLNTRQAFGAPLPTLTKAPLLARVMAARKPVVSDLYPSPLLATPIFSIGVPVKDNPRLALFAAIGPERLAPILSEQKLPGTWRAAVTDASGSVVARTHDIQKYLGKKVTPDLLLRMERSAEGAFETKTLDGIPVVTAYSRSRISGWTVVLGMPLSEVTAGIRQTLSWLIAATCAALAAGLLCAWILGGRIARSIRALVAPAQALGSGEPIRVDLEIYLREADEVAKAMTRASQVLEQHAREIEQTHASLRKSEEHHRTLVEWSPEAIIVHRDGQFLYLNPAANKMLGATPEHGLIEQSILDLVHPDFQAMMRQRVHGHVEQGSTMPRVEVQFIRLDGAIIDVEVHGTAIVYDGLPAIHSSMRDITTRKRAQEVQRWAAMLFANIHDGAAVTDRHGVILAINPAFTLINGYAAAEIVGRNMRVVHSGRQDATFYAQMWQAIRVHGAWQGEVWNRRQNGEIYLSRLAIGAVYDPAGEVTNYVSTSVDLTRLKHADRMEHLAHHDALTGLPNRLQLMLRLNHALEIRQRQGGLGAVLFLDLDRFKAVNDTWGHPAGDDLLQQVAKRLATRMRAMDTLARLGGDEFVAVLESIEKADNAATLADEFVRLLNQPFVLVGGQEVQIGGSVGIAMFPTDADSAETLLLHADAALYRAKEAGRNTYRFHHQA